MGMPRPAVRIVWFKRDLRVTDHAPLNQTSRQGPVLPLFVVEADCWCEPDASGRQYEFVKDGYGVIADAIQERTAAAAAACPSHGRIARSPTASPRWGCRQRAVRSAAEEGKP